MDVKGGEGGDPGRAGQPGRGGVNGHGPKGSFSIKPRDGREKRGGGKHGRRGPQGSTRVALVANGDVNAVVEEMSAPPAPAAACALIPEDGSGFLEFGAVVDLTSVTAFVDGSGTFSAGVEFQLFAEPDGIVALDPPGASPVLGTLACGLESDHPLDLGEETDRKLVFASADELGFPESEIPSEPPVVEVTIGIITYVDGIGCTETLATLPISFPLSIVGISDETTFAPGDIASVDIVVANVSLNPIPTSEALVSAILPEGWGPLDVVGPSEIPGSSPDASHSETVLTVKFQVPEETAPSTSWRIQINLHCRGRIVHAVLYDFRVAEVFRVGGDDGDGEQSGVPKDLLLVATSTLSANERKAWKNIATNLGLSYDVYDVDAMGGTLEALEDGSPAPWMGRYSKSALVFPMTKSEDLGLLTPRVLSHQVGPRPGPESSLEAKIPASGEGAQPPLLYGSLGNGGDSSTASAAGPSDGGGMEFSTPICCGCHARLTQANRVICGLCAQHMCSACCPYTWDLPHAGEMGVYAVCHPCGIAALESVAPYLGDIPGSMLLLNCDPFQVSYKVFAGASTTTLGGDDFVKDGPGSVRFTASGLAYEYAKQVSDSDPHFRARVYKIIGTANESARLYKDPGRKQLGSALIQRCPLPKQSRVLNITSYVGCEPLERYRHALDFVSKTLYYEPDRMESKHIKDPAYGAFWFLLADPEAAGWDGGDFAFSQLIIPSRPMQAVTGIISVLSLSRKIELLFDPRGVVPDATKGLVIVDCAAKGKTWSFYDLVSACIYGDLKREFQSFSFTNPVLGSLLAMVESQPERFTEGDAEVARVALLASLVRLERTSRTGMFGGIPNKSGKSKQKEQVSAIMDALGATKKEIKAAKAASKAGLKPRVAMWDSAQWVAAAPCGEEEQRVLLARERYKWKSKRPQPLAGGFVFVSQADVDAWGLDHEPGYRP